MARSGGDSGAFLIYGANGYTGALIAEEALRRRMRPIVAGRNGQAVAALGKRLGLEARVFGSAMAEEIVPDLDGVRAVLHCAGPFSATAKPMMKACLEKKCHYLDISGEIRSHERILSQPGLFRDAGIVAIPGVGFDVVPTDCVAGLLHRKLPDATRLTLALNITGGPSPGSFKTLVEGLHAGGLVRRDGKLAPIPAASKIRRIPFHEGPRDAVIAPWADLASAWHSTGIPDIETYIVIKKSVVAMMRLSRFAGPIFALRPMRGLLKSAIGQLVRGPGASERSERRYEIWAETEAPGGRRRRMHVLTPNGYEVTVDGSLRAMAKVLDGEVSPGAYTPAMAFGPRFLFDLHGIRVLHED